MVSISILVERFGEWLSDQARHYRIKRHICLGCGKIFRDSPMIHCRSCLNQQLGKENMDAIFNKYPPKEYW